MVLHGQNTRTRPQMQTFTPCVRLEDVSSVILPRRGFVKKKQNITRFYDIIIIIRDGWLSNSSWIRILKFSCFWKFYYTKFNASEIVRKVIILKLRAVLHKTCTLPIRIVIYYFIFVDHDYGWTIRTVWDVGIWTLNCK